LADSGRRGCSPSRRRATRRRRVPQTGTPGPRRTTISASSPPLQKADVPEGGRRLPIRRGAPNGLLPQEKRRNGVAKVAALPTATSRPSNQSPMGRATTTWSPGGGAHHPPLQWARARRATCFFFQRQQGTTRPPREAGQAVLSLLMGGEEGGDGGSRKPPPESAGCGTQHQAPPRSRPFRQRFKPPPRLPAACWCLGRFSELPGPPQRRGILGPVRSRCAKTRHPALSSKARPEGLNCELLLPKRFPTRKGN